MAIIKVKGAGKTVCNDFESANNTLARMRGLMFRARPVSILFDFYSEGIYPIHSFFVRFDFDAIYLDSDFRVVEAFESVKPNTALVKPTKNARYLLETASGACAMLGIKPGTALEIL